MAQQTVISIFTGAGGLDLGFEAANYRTNVAIEFDSEAVRTLRANRDWSVIDRDIHSVSSEELMQTAGISEGDADVLIGGPPCQPFSKAGYWSSGDTARLDDPRASTMACYLRVLRDTLPRAFLLENVPGLVYKGKSEGLDFIKRAIDRINQSRGTDYSISVAQLNAADYGVPQIRQRVFVIGSREGVQFEFPAPTHQPPPGTGQNSLTDLPTHLTSWDAIGDLQDAFDEEELGATGKWAGLLPSIPEGENYLWHTERGGGLEIFGWRRRFWSFLLKLAKDRPSWTIQAQPGPAVGPFHWASRRLATRELCRLQTFPDGYRILGGVRSAQKQIGNAVPSALAELLAHEIRRQLLGQTSSYKLSLVPTSRRPIPPPEEVKTVPARYRKLVGEHEPHPGTGKGYGAAGRSTERRVGQQAALPLFR